MLPRPTRIIVDVQLVQAYLPAPTVPGIYKFHLQSQLHDSLTNVFTISFQELFPDPKFPIGSCEVESTSLTVLETRENEMQPDVSAPSACFVLTKSSECAATFRIDSVAL